MSEKKVLSKKDLGKCLVEVCKAYSTEAEAIRAINAVIKSLETNLSQGNDVLLVGFGKFSISARNARKGRNPQTGKEINIPASKVVTFKAGKALKESVNQ